MSLNDSGVAQLTPKEATAGSDTTAPDTVKDTFDTLLEKAEDLVDAVKTTLEEDEDDGGGDGDDDPDFELTDITEGDLYSYVPEQLSPSSFTPSTESSSEISTFDKELTSDKDDGITATPKTPRDFTKTAPTITIPPNEAVKPGEGPSFDETLTYPSMPTKPDIDPDEMLTEIKAFIEESSIPEEHPTWKKASFDKTLTFDPTEGYTDTRFNFLENAGEKTSLTDAIVSVLTAAIEEGTGLSDGVENALWERAKDRIADEYESEYNRTDAKMAAAGWDIPTGAHLAEISTISGRRARALEQANYEIMAENAKLAFQDRQHALQYAVQMEGILRDYLTGFWGRSLEAAKEVAAEGARLFDIVVKQNMLRLEEYKTLAHVFEVNVRNNFTELEAFKLKLDATGIQKDIRGQDAQMHIAWMQAAEAASSVYDSQVRGALGEIEIAKAKVGVFAEKIRAYVSENQAYSAQVGAWGEEVKAEAIKVDAYASEARAYAAEVGGIEAYNRAMTAKAEVELKTLLLKVENFKGQVMAYQAKMGAESAQADADSKQIQAEASAFAAEQGAIGDIARANAASWQAVASGQESINRSRIENARFVTDKAMRKLQLKIEKMKLIAGSQTQLAAAALAGLNVSATVSSQDSSSWSAGVRLEQSISNRYSYTEQG